MNSFYLLNKKSLRLFLISLAVIALHFFQLQAQSSLVPLSSTTPISQLNRGSLLYYAPFSSVKHGVFTANQEVIAEENEEEEAEDASYSDAASSVNQFFVLEHLLASCIKTRISYIELSVFTHATIPLFVTQHSWRSGFVC
jgi:hypothetical protein